MTARPKFIEHLSSASEKSIYFDAPIMHIFSKKKTSQDEGGTGPNFIAPTRDTNASPEPVSSSSSASRIRTTTSLSGGELADRNETPTQPAGKAVADVPATPPDSESDSSVPEHSDKVQNVHTQDFAAAAHSPSPVASTITPSKSKSKMNTGSTLKKHRREGSTQTDPLSDSGYDSTSSPRNRPLSFRNSADIQPIPVVWADGATHANDDHDNDDTGDRNPPQRAKSRSAFTSNDMRRSRSLRSYRSLAARSDWDQDGQESFRTAPSRISTTRRRSSFNGGSFASGAGTVGPNSRPDEEELGVFRARSVSAGASLSKKQKMKLNKEEIKDGKRMAKIIKKEAKAEREALDIAVRELGDLQKIQKYSVKEEAKTNAAYAQALKVFRKEELAYLSARAKFERAQADLQAYEDAREAARDHAQQATEMLQEKNREVEWLRAQKAADDREREAKLLELSGKA